MGVYRIKVKGRETSILLRAKSKTEAIDLIVVEAKALTADEVEEAFAEGGKLWKPEDALPADVDVDADELAYLQYFHGEADFGPADGDVRAIINESYVKSTGKPVPEAYADEPDAE